MAEEAQLRCSLFILKGKLKFQNSITAFNADVEGANGPTPGSINVPAAGVNVDLSQLTEFGGLAAIENISETETVEYGIKAGGTFYPLGSAKPGEAYPLRLSPSIEYGATGTASTQNLHIRSLGATCVVNIFAFDP